MNPYCYYHTILDGGCAACNDGLCVMLHYTSHTLGLMDGSPEGKHFLSAGRKEEEEKSNCPWFFTLHIILLWCLRNFCGWSVRLCCVVSSCPWEWPHEGNLGSQVIERAWVWFSWPITAARQDQSCGEDNFYIVCLCLWGCVSKCLPLYVSIYLLKLSLYIYTLWCFINPFL